ncbi:MAG: glycosyltransferase [Phascolarctobacterium sp.]|uniref:glycosyltransferase n=1 Tax=Phascolarctobacterium sp. TaxID=2049039 RepID=UPI0026DDB410|nr:glycosyltransferase [Phascolarctobacterium sp.]MDO4921263.1 glycosyltransferase [Phascolarctobacterium sp.]
MKIGIFLGYGPQVKLGKEGLGRYIGGLIKGFQEENHNITIACPFWLLSTLNELLDTFSANKNNITIITTKDNPPLWKLYSFFKVRRKTSGLKHIVLSHIILLIKRLLVKVSDAKSTFSFAIWSILALLASIIFLLPSFLIISVYALIILIKLAKSKKIPFNIKINKILEYIRYKYNFFYRMDVPLYLFSNMVDEVLKNLVGIINKLEKQDVWFVPAIFWPQINNIHGTVVINAPDLVTQEFPYEFSNVYNAENSTDKCRKTILEGKFFITYCEYLRKVLLVDQYSKDDKNTVAINHANNDMLTYIKVDDTLANRVASDNDWTDIFARDLLQSCGSRNVKYIFYASQVRPNKNMLNLIKAYEYLVRRKFCTYKLYITADLQKKTEIGSYIKEHRLENDIISLYNVPAQTLAALYHCADLVVNPTLYEGGFPFTFGEGMSVGTPSIMSDIPQVREVLEPAGLEEIMFDPYDWRAIADKIEWALADIDGLYRKELPLYEEMAKRTYSVVAADYVKAFETFIEKDKRNE